MATLSAGQLSYNLFLTFVGVKKESCMGSYVIYYNRYVGVVPLSCAWLPEGIAARALGADECVCPLK